MGGTVPRAPLKGGALWGTVSATVPHRFLGLGHGLLIHRQVWPEVRDCGV